MRQSASGRKITASPAAIRPKRPLPPMPPSLMPMAVITRVRAPAITIAAVAIALAAGRQVRAEPLLPRKRHPRMFRLFSALWCAKRRFIFPSTCPKRSVFPSGNRPVLYTGTPFRRESKCGTAFRSTCATGCTPERRSGESLNAERRSGKVFTRGTAFRSTTTS